MSLLGEKRTARRYVWFEFLNWGLMPISVFSSPTLFVGQIRTVSHLRRAYVYVPVAYVVHSVTRGYSRYASWLTSYATFPLIFS